jgi:cob(I)alamin adenosyltransferase
MQKTKIYTRKGDQGITGLVSGTRIKKSDPRIQLYGEVDELNSYIGLGISFLPAEFNKVFLHEIQSSLFDLGSNLACENEKRGQFKLPRLKDKLIEKLEKEIDHMDSSLPILKTFILPGGTLEASAFHICRTVTRKVERQMVDYEGECPGEIPEGALRFINRLSDYFFVLARYVNHTKGINEINWIASQE